MKKIFSVIALTLAMLFLFTACGNGDSDEGTKSDSGSDSNDKLTVNTTVYPLKSFTEQIGGKHVDVKSIYPAGTDLHTYDPSQKDIVNASKADLFIYTGDDLDPVAKKVADTIDNDDKKLSLQAGLDKKDLLKDEHHHDHEHGDDEHGHDHHEDADEEHNHDHHEDADEEHDHDHHEDADEEHDHEHEDGEGEEEHHHHHGLYDPHVWLDPKLDQQFAKNIKDELVEKDPDNKDYYEDNYKKLDKDLKDIDKKLKDVTDGKEDSKVYISHESIGYLADRYGFEQKGIQNMNAEDPSQKELTDIVKQIKDEDAKYILFEDNVENKVTDVIRDETDAEPLKFYNMESLTKEQENDDDLSFQKLMNKDIEALEKALSGDSK